MAKREYDGEGITVHWNSELCIHTGICLKDLPQVFDNEARPWVAVENANAEEIAQVVEGCPSGALTYTRTDGEPGEQSPAQTTVIPVPNGPLRVRGELEVRDARGNLFKAGPRFTLCRCGASQNQPFCDLSHRDIRFRNNPRAIAESREAAESPKDISPGP